jgi:hypothetical protein
VGVDAEREAEDEDVDGGSGSRSNNIPGTVRTGVSAGAGEGGEEGTRGEEEGTGGGSIVSFPLWLIVVLEAGASAPHANGAAR